MARTIDISRKLGLRPGLIPALVCVVCAVLFGASCPAASTAGIHALLIGGGPDKEDNTAQIEEHLRFVTSLVPASSGRIVLFADGKLSSRDLTYTDSSHLTPGQRALDILLPNDGLGAKVLTRTPVLGATLDGPSKLPVIDRSFHRLAGLSGRNSPPVLLYFAGHGSLDDNKDKTSLYDLWDDDDLNPSTLLREIETLPPRVPVVLVMAQCFSGGFGNVLFKKANPGLPLNDHPIIGFFASESDREAAGCGTDTNSPLYQDFSSYFFGALSGRDRLGRRVEGADFDGDGRVTCHEAWCYALIHDDSIDTPVCTSMIFLRRYSDVPDATIFSTPWNVLLEGATPGERAALEALSAKLGLDGEQRLLAAYDRLMFSDPVGQPEKIHAYRDAQDRLNALRLSSLGSLFQKWPALRWRDNSPAYNRAARGAALDLGKDTSGCENLVRTRDAFDRADAALDEEESLLVRFTDLGEAIVRARHLREHGDAGVKARFDALWQAEQQPLGIFQAAR
jgi:hypothetical protein